MKWTFYAGSAAALLSTACAVPSPGQCFEPVRIADLPAALDEASGIALSRRDPDVLWAHNDSEGTATLYALDRSARLTAEVALPAAGRQSDWEDIAAGPCPTGDCLYIADIGDNLHNRDDRAILRITEPHIDAPAPVDVERFPIMYPDGPVDAEALFVMPDTSVYIVTKGRRNGVSLYLYPPPLRSGDRVMLEHVQQLADGVAQLPDLITAADASRDGARVAIRSYTRVLLFRFDADTLVRLNGDGHDITTLAEPQGEAIAYAGGDTLLLATETGPAGAQPFISQLRCSSRWAVAELSGLSSDGSVIIRVAARMVHSYPRRQTIAGQRIAPRKEYRQWPHRTIDRTAVRTIRRTRLVRVRRAVVVRRIRRLPRPMRRRAARAVTFSVASASR